MFPSKLVTSPQSHSTAPFYVCRNNMENIRVAFLDLVHSLSFLTTPTAFCFATARLHRQIHRRRIQWFYSHAKALSLSISPPTHTRTIRTIILAKISIVWNGKTVVECVDQTTPFSQLLHGLRIAYVSHFRLSSVVCCISYPIRVVQWEIFVRRTKFSHRHFGTYLNWFTSGSIQYVKERRSIITRVAATNTSSSAVRIMFN